eukprot:520041-Pleurochrysis_carterae.AAC.2
MKDGSRQPRVTRRLGADGRAAYRCKNRGQWTGETKFAIATERGCAHFGEMARDPKRLIAKFLEERAITNAK